MYEEKLIHNSTYSERLASAICISLLASTSAVLCGCVVLVTILGDLYKKPVNLLVANVASADLLLSIVNLIFQPVNILSETKDFYCNWAGWLTYICGLQANWGVPILVLNRYMAIFHPNAFKRYSSTRHICMVIGLNWTLIILITCSFHAVGRTGYERSYENCGVNNEDSTLWTVLVWTTCVLPTFIGVSVTAYCNLRIFTKLRQHATDNMVQNNVVSRNKEMLYVTLLHVSFAVFLQSPYILGKLIPDMVENNVLRQIFPCLYLANSTVNPLATLFVIKPYRDAATKLVSCQKSAQVAPGENTLRLSVIKQSPNLSHHVHSQNMTAVDM